MAAESLDGVMREKAALGVSGDITYVYNSIREELPWCRCPLMSLPTMKELIGNLLSRKVACTPSTTFKISHQLQRSSSLYIWSWLTTDSSSWLTTRKMKKVGRRATVQRKKKTHTRLFCFICCDGLRHMSQYKRHPGQSSEGGAYRRDHCADLCYWLF